MNEGGLANPSQEVTMTQRVLAGWCAVGMSLGLSAQALAADAAVADAAAPAAAPRVVRKKAVPVKVSTTQLFTTLGTLESKIDMIQKSLLTMPKQAAAPTVQMPGPGEGMEAKAMMQAFYNYGSYMKEAANKRTAASVIWDITVVGGTALAIQGWEASRDHWQPTPNNYGNYRHVPLTFRYATPYYTNLTVGVSTVIIGMMVSEFINWSAIGSEKQAAAALMRPLESQPQSTAP